MTDIKINSPAISAFYKSVAEDIRSRVPREYNPLEVAAACTKTAQRLAGDDVPDRSHYKDALALYLQDLPSDPALATATIKHDAGVALGIPQLASDFDQLQAAREALAEAEAAVMQAEAKEGQRILRLKQLDGEMFKLQEHINSWNLDFDLIVANAEACISEEFGKTGPESIYSDQRVNVSFEDIARVAVLRRLAPAAIKKLQAKLDALSAEHNALRDAAPEVVAKPEPAPMKLTRGRQKLASDPEPELAPA